jgi:tetratricopeptide (TPR) repeat protein
MIFSLFPYYIFNKLNRLKFSIPPHFNKKNAIRVVSVVLFFFISIYASSQNTKDHPATWFFEKGELTMQQKDWSNAQLLFTECLRKDPGLADAYYSRGITREQLQDNEGALTDYNIYIELKPEHYEALLNRGALFYKLKRYEQARQDFLKLLTLPQGETTTVFFRQDAFASSVNKIFTTQSSNNKAYLYNHLGLTETNLKNFKQAITWYDSAIKAQPQEADYYVNRGLARKLSGDHDGAVSDYRAALKLNPNHELALHNLLSSKEKTAIGTSRMDELIDSNPSLPYPYAERAFERMENKNWKGALEDYNRAFEIDSTNEEYVLNRGLVKEKLKDFVGAYKDYSQAIALKPDFEKAWLNRGNLLSRQNKLSEAIEDYTIAIFYFPEYASAYYNRGIAYHRLKQDDKACSDIKKAETLGINIEPSLSKICSNNQRK